MTRSIGNLSVVDMLATTAVELQTVDLRGSEPPSDRPIPGAGPRYVERQEIGRGGLGVVVEAFDVDLRREVAIKRPLGSPDDGEQVAALVKEAQVTAQLEHPNVASVHTLGIDESGRPYFVMTRLQGRTLAELLRRSRRAKSPWGRPGCCASSCRLATRSPSPTAGGSCTVISSRPT